MRPIFTVALLLMMSLSPSPSLAEQSANCPRTYGSDKLLGAPFPESENWYGSEALAVRVPGDSLWSTTKPGSRIAVKLFWWSSGLQPGADTTINVNVTNLNDQSVEAKVTDPTTAYADSLGGWTMLVGIDFPTAGCWQISGEYLGQKLTFVVETTEYRAMNRMIGLEDVLTWISLFGGGA